MARFNAVLHGVVGYIVHDGCSQRQANRHARYHRKSFDDAVVARLGIIVNGNERSTRQTRKLKIKESGYDERERIRSGNRPCKKVSRRDWRGESPEQLRV
jgi:hypothetical protein